MKCLDRVWDAFPSWNCTSSLLFDDKPEKWLPQLMCNAVHPTDIVDTISMIDYDEENQKNQFHLFENINNKIKHSKMCQFMWKTISDYANVGWTVGRNKKVISKKKEVHKIHLSYFCKVTQEAMTSIQKDAGKKKTETDDNKSSARPAVRDDVEENIMFSSSSESDDNNCDNLSLKYDTNEFIMLSL